MRQAVLGVALVGVLLSAGCADGAVTAPDDRPALPTLVPGTLTACVAPGAGLAPPSGAALEAFDRAVLAAVADELAVDLEVRPTDLEDVVSGVAVNAGECDVAAAAVVDRGTLASVVTTSAPYHRVHRLVLATTPGVTVDPAAVTGSVGFEEGGPAADAAAALSAADAVALPSRADLARALAADVVAAAVVPVDERAALEAAIGRALVVRAVVPTDTAAVLLLPLDAEPTVADAIDDAITSLGVDGRLEALADELLHR